ncbi:hypothetical protein [uncultured Bacteroides sp.]|uniref:hypothetical protein n=1 Tax=uncultured Bacteroides sp. TaxID=162156 RepID=UPI0025929A97|nr:hypothetical protein [uncultured Bacteroides sp.]
MGTDTISADFERLKSACADLSGKKIYVGIVSSADSEVLKIAHAHEYGTEKLPERSFIRASFDADQDKLDGIITGSVEKVLSGAISADAAANAIGAQAAQLVQNFIDDNRVKPKSDFSKKTQHTTLYETGTHIRDRIAYEVEG